MVRWGEVEGGLYRYVMLLYVPLGEGGGGRLIWVLKWLRVPFGPKKVSISRAHHFHCPS
jgi:hypothetical protein